jgi:hypothetical protein
MEWIDICSVSSASHRSKALNSPFFNSTATKELNYATVSKSNCGNHVLRLVGARSRSAGPFRYRIHHKEGERHTLLGV